MKLETFYAELFKRLGVDNQTSSQSARQMVFAVKVASVIDTMTGGALFKGVDKISEDWEFPK